MPKKGNKSVEAKETVTEETIVKRFAVFAWNQVLGGWDDLVGVYATIEEASAVLDGIAWSTTATVPWEWQVVDIVAGRKLAPAEYTWKGDDNAS